MVNDWIDNKFRRLMGNELNGLFLLSCLGGKIEKLIKKENKK